MGKTPKEMMKRDLISITKRLQEKGRPSVTFGRSDIIVILPILEEKLSSIDPKKKSRAGK